MDSKDSDMSLSWRAVVRQASDLSLLGEGNTASTSSNRSRPSQQIRRRCELDNATEGDKATACPKKYSNSSSFRRRICKYDVFISFRGPDTRNSFVDHLYHHLIRKGIFAFKDDQRLQKGVLISPQLVQAIQDSRVAIIVFSKDYAASSWCLNEMAIIANCHQLFNQTVFPIFYDVDPSHVRKQNGVYKNAFSLHAQNFKHNPGIVERWKRAMTGLARSVGWDVRNKPEFGEVENIVQAAIKILGHKFSGFADDLIGIQPRVEELEEHLKLSSENDDFRVLGIWGMGGIGKTTHATVLYDKISYQFDAHCYIENVSKIYGDGGAIAVQKQILHQTIDETNLEICSPSEISGMVRYRLHNIKVLLVLDNVDQLEQLEELAINPKLLHTGSRMIITTRDEHILKVYGAHGMYKVQLLNDKDAHELFCKKAFKSEHQNSSCEKLIPVALKYTQCLPLAIKVVGSFLCTRDFIQWKDALDRLKNYPDKKIMDVLQVSVDGLHRMEKEIFLHIACFFKGEREDYVKRILDSCGLHPHIGIPSIIEKSLITIRNQEIDMHEMLQELGKKIVRHQWPEKPGWWSRLWLYEDLYTVLMTKSGTDNVEAIVLHQKENVSKCWVGGLSKLRNLKLLILYYNSFLGILDFLSNKLQYLFWHGYPSASLPSNFEPYYLVELNMPNCRIQRLWEDRKDLPYLKRMDLSNSQNLIETPNLEGSRRLERLDFTGCTNLMLVHPSIGLLTELAFLSLRNCSNLVCIDFGGTSILCSLRVLYLSGCTKLENMPNFTRVPNLEYLDIDGCTSLSTIHESIGFLSKLRFLSLRNCTNLVSIPDHINTLTSLIILDLRSCLKVNHLPLVRTISSPCLDSLIFLDLGFCKLIEVPAAIGDLKCLERLNLQGNNFESMPHTIIELSWLAYLNLAHCHELRSFPRPPSARSSSVGRYFKIASGSRDHRSGLYVFNCPEVPENRSRLYWSWLVRLLMEPGHFRCGFDIVVPWHWINFNSPENLIIPECFSHRFKGDSVIRIVHSKEDDKWFGFAFCVAFEVYNSPRHLFSLPLPHPFYLSFESEYTEERFDMPLNLELNKNNGSKYLWIIYISREHCHFVKTGAHITFKARPGLMVKEWGLSTVFKDGIRLMWPQTNLQSSHADHLVIDNVDKSSSGSELKIQLPYNWLVTEEDEVENFEAKAKENSLSNLGLHIGQPQ